MKYLKFFSLLKIILLIYFIFPNNLFSQDDDFENYSFEDEKLSSPKNPYFALSFGGNISFIFMDYTDINSKPLYKGTWKDIGTDMEFFGPLTGWEFNFFTATSPLINNARLGINYQYCSQTRQKDDILPSNDSIDNTIATVWNWYRSLSISLTGIHFDYAIVPFKSMAILPGVGVKFGKMTLEQFLSSDTNNTWNPYTVTYDYYVNEKIVYSFISLEPQLNLEYALTGFLMLRVSGSYQFTFNNPFVKNVWKINGDNAYRDVPSGVSPKGFHFSAGLFLGLFNY